MATKRHHQIPGHGPGALRRRAEAWMRKSPPGIADTSGREVRRLVHELQVHQVELEMQNEELRRARLQLESSRDRFSLLYDFAPVGYLTLDAEGVIQEANLGAAKLLGLERRSLIRRKLAHFVVPEAQDAFGLLQRRIFTSGAQDTGVLRLKKSGDAVFTAELVGIATDENPGGQRLCLLALIDITTRLQDEAVRQSERTLADFFDQAPIGLLWVDADGRIQRVNEAGLDLFGYSRQDLLAHRVAEFHAFPEMAAELLNRVANQETVQNHPTRLRCRDGSYKLVLIDANGLWQQGRLIHSRWFVRDITWRQELEREILAITEHEQRRIGQDLHDDLCQQLAGIGFMSQTMASRLAIQSPAEAAQAREIARLLTQATNHTRELAHGLSPVRLDDEGLMDALRQLAFQTQGLYEITTCFWCDRPVQIHDPVVGIHLYRIAQQAVGNALKHAKARRLDIGLTSRQDQVILTVQDDGVGIPKKLPPKRGMGLRIMSYRAGVIGASLVIKRQPKGGTAVVCAVKNEGKKPR